MSCVTLDAMMGFSFGEGFELSMTGPNLEAVRRSESEVVGRVRGTGKDEVVEFPTGEIPEFFEACLFLAKVPAQLQGNPLPRLTWAYLNCKPSIRRATRIKDGYIERELGSAVKKMVDGGDEGEVVKSAVGNMVRKERELAEKDGRKPAYSSGVMKDEVCYYPFYLSLSRS